MAKKDEDEERIEECILSITSSRAIAYFGVIGCIILEYWGIWNHDFLAIITGGLLGLANLAIIIGNKKSNEQG